MMTPEERSRLLEDARPSPEQLIFDLFAGYQHPWYEEFLSRRCSRGQIELAVLRDACDFLGKYDDILGRHAHAECIGPVQLLREYMALHDMGATKELRARRKRSNGITV